MGKIENKFDTIGNKEEIEIIRKNTGTGIRVPSPCDQENVNGKLLTLPNIHCLELSIVWLSIGCSRDTSA